MARARLVVADTNSGEIEQLRRTLNSLLHMLESAEASLDNSATAEAVLAAWAAAVRTGTDDNPDSETGVLPSGREIVGLKPTPTHPRRPKGALAEMSVNDDF